MRFFYDNWLDYAATVFTESSENTAFPSSNVANQLRAQPWRTGVSAAAEWAQFDLGSAKAVTSFIVLDHNLTAGDTLIKIEGNTTSSFASPAFSQALTWASGVISATFASQSYRYWRFSFTKSAAGETRDIGRLFLGTYYTTTERPDYDGWKRGHEDLSIRQRTVGGQYYFEARQRYRTGKFDFSEIENTQKESLVTIAERVGIHTSFFVQADETAASGEAKEIVYVNFSDLPDFSVSSFDSDYRWSGTLSVEEQL
jgi:hypothetical protein